MKFLLKYRRPFVVALQLGAAALSHYAALLLRFDGYIPPDQVVNFVSMLPWLLVIRGLTFIPFRLYEGLWRYAGFWDLRNIVSAALTGSLAFYGLTHWGFGLVSYPRSVFLIDGVLLVFLLGGLRMSRRVYRRQSRPARDKRVIIYGAGDAGEMIVRDMRRNPSYGYDPIGFFDDDPAKRGRRIHGVKVLGGRTEIGRVMAERRPGAIVIAIPRAEAGTLRSIVQALEGYKIPIQTLPNLRDLLDGKVTVNRIRTLAVEDLLERSPVPLNVDRVRSLVHGKRILITGAGGSIGSELARQIWVLGPSALVLLDRYENSLHAVATELQATSASGALEIVVADVTDRRRMDHVLRSHRPKLIFHAAAHKHVPLMELNACEAVKNNVGGTRIVAEAGAASGVERFVLISTDKAVNPSSVMGATKRVAELLIQDLERKRPVLHTTVRFGNVLGSNGSVLPRFLAQVKAGGPVTITHPEMRRYFMLIPEAVHLILHAAALARGGDIFVLDMGEQVKIVDLARNVIRLSGLIPDDEIALNFVGLRPGEKLQEELVGSDEVAMSTSVERILHVVPQLVPETDELASEVIVLERLAKVGDEQAVLKKLRELVPTYRPTSVEEALPSAETEPKRLRPRA